MTTETEAREIQAAIEAFQLKDLLDLEVAATTRRNSEIAWFGTQNIPVATTKAEALTNFETIVQLIVDTNDDFKTAPNDIQRERFRVRLGILSEEKDKANAEFITLKEIGV